MSDDYDERRRREEEDRRRWEAEQWQRRDAEDRQRRQEDDARAFRYFSDRGRAHANALQGLPGDSSSQGAIDGTISGQRERAAREASALRLPEIPLPRHLPQGQFTTGRGASVPNEGAGWGCGVLVLALTAVSAVAGAVIWAFQAASSAMSGLSHGLFILCLWGAYVLIGTIIVALGVSVAERGGWTESTSLFRRWTVAFVSMTVCAGTTWIMEVLSRGLASFARAILYPAGVLPWSDLLVVQLPGLLVASAVLLFGLGDSHRTPACAIKAIAVATVAACIALAVVVTLGLLRVGSGS